MDNINNRHLIVSIIYFAATILTPIIGITLDQYIDIDYTKLYCAEFFMSGMTTAELINWIRKL